MFVKDSIGAVLQECFLTKTKQSEVVKTYYIGHDPDEEQKRHPTMVRLDEEIQEPSEEMDIPVRYEWLAVIGKSGTQIRLHKKDDVLFRVLF